MKQKTLKRLAAAMTGLLLASCGQQAKPTDTAAETSDSTSVVRNDSTDIADRITSIYNDVFGIYQQNNDPDRRVFDRKYLTADFLCWQHRVDSIAELHMGEIIGPDSDHWILGQDWDKLTMRIDSISLKEQPVAFITVIHGGKMAPREEHVALLLQKGDDGNWLIDDFMAYGTGEKDFLKICTAEERINNIYTAIIAECKRQSTSERVANLASFNAAPYLSESYLRLYQQVDSLDEANNAEGLRFFNSDHWGLGQEYSSMDEARIDSCQMMSDKRAYVKATLTVTSIGTKATEQNAVRLFMVWEDGLWRIDDFMNGTLSEKNLMTEYLKDEGKKHD